MIGVCFAPDTLTTHKRHKAPFKWTLCELPRYNLNTFIFLFWMFKNPAEQGVNLQPLNLT